MGNFFGMNYWLVKQEPGTYSWQKFVGDGKTEWTGVRNYQARNNLKEMGVDDKVLYYHSGSDAPEGTTFRAIVGIARVVREHYPDPTAKEGDWVCVDLSPVEALPQPVSLDAIKSDPALAQMGLVRQSRLSVMPVSKSDYSRILKLGGLKAGKQK